MKSNDDKSWWYESDGERAGPVGFDKICELIGRGDIVPQTLVWTEDMSDWSEAESISALINAFKQVPPPLPPPPHNDESLSGSEELPTDPPSRETFVESLGRKPFVNKLATPVNKLATPWPRFFARLLDIWIESIPAGILLVVVLTSMDAQMADQLLSNVYTIGFLALPIVMVIDGILVGLFGNSIGKAILGIKVEPIGADSLGVGAAIRRNFGVWFHGLAIGFPIVNLFTMSSAYNTLKSGERLTWDNDANVRVLRTGSEAWRYVTFTILFVVMSVLNMALSEL